jgi:DNA-binding NtrC family response regulator
MERMAEKGECVLVVDDDVALGRVLVAMLGQAGFSSVHVTSGAEALRRLEARPFDALLTDLRMPEMDGMAVLKAVGQRWPAVPVIMLTAHGSVRGAVEAMKAGAVDFMVKPCEKEELVFVLDKALTATRRERGGVPSAPTGDLGMIGDSPAMRALRARIQRAAAATSTVLIRGETGTGKELVAHAVHAGSERRDGPLVKLNCGELPETLLESELFGHEKGAFSGAVGRKPGRVELAHKGTLFLDEVGEMSASMQVKLLRVLEYREFQRVGGTQKIEVDVRFVAATHRDLEARVASGEFREDLYHRLYVVPLDVPPLRERHGDVELIASKLCALFGHNNNRPAVRFTDESLALLAAQPWPGNVRALRNVVERLVVLVESDEIGPLDVEREMARRPLGGGVAPRSEGGGTGGTGGSSPAGGGPASLPARRHDAEKDAVLHALARANNDRTLAARLLQVSRSTLYNKLRKSGLAETE